MNIKPQLTQQILGIKQLISARKHRRARIINKLPLLYNQSAS